MHIARVGERLPRLQIQFRISRSFRPRNLANLGSKIRFWIRRKEHTLNGQRDTGNKIPQTPRETLGRPSGSMRTDQFREDLVEISFGSSQEPITVEFIARDSRYSGFDSPFHCMLYFTELSQF